MPDAQQGLPLNEEQIEQIIPHRAPMRLIDGIDELEPGVSANGWKNITEWDCEGHFPDYLVFPGVKIVEGLAQTGAVALLSVPENHGKIAFFAGIDKVRFKGQVRPEDCLRYETTLTKMRGPIGFGEAKAYVGERLVCSAELMFALSDPPTQ